MNLKSVHAEGSAGFSLLELLLAMTVLALIVVVVSQMLSKTQSAIVFSRRALDVDDQARLAFARMANDLGKIVNRRDVDFLFAKQTGNDKIFFYSQSVGDTTNGVFTNNGQAENPVSLVGYTVATDPTFASYPLLDLQRLGRALNWLPINGANDNMVFLTPAPTGTSYFAPASTLDGHWSTAYSGTFNSIGTPPTYTPAAPVDPDYHVIGDQIFRFEYCFLLKDGYYSDYPAEAETANVPSGSAPLITAAKCPTVNDDSANTAGDGVIGIGTRWFDTNAGRAYICTSSTTGAAAWQGLGLRDVSAVVVAIALLDRTSRLQMVTMGGHLGNLASLFSDSGFTPTGSGSSISNTSGNGIKLMLQNWNATLLGSGFSSSLAAQAGISTGAATGVAAHISVYQRYFYINSSASY